MGGDAPALAIRRATANDAAVLAAFAARTFSESFGAENRPEDMAAHLATAFGVRQQTAELENPDYVTLLGHVDERHIATSEPATPAADRDLAAFAQLRRTSPPPCAASVAAIEIHRFYVDRRWHGRGVGARLMEAALDVAREMGGRDVWLSVWERNPRAIAFYRKCGFTTAGTTDFWVGADRQTDFVLVRRL